MNEEVKILLINKNTEAILSFSENTQIISLQRFNKETGDRYLIDFSIREEGDYLDFTKESMLNFLRGR